MCLLWKGLYFECFLCASFFHLFFYHVHIFDIENFHMRTRKFTCSFFECSNTAFLRSGGVTADNTACRRCSTDDRDWSTVGETSNATGDEKTQLMCVLACQPCSKRGWSQVTYEATPSNPVPPSSVMVVAFSPNHWLLTDSLG